MVLRRGSDSAKLIRDGNHLLSFMLMLYAFLRNFTVILLYLSLYELLRRVDESSV